MKAVFIAALLCTFSPPAEAETPWQVAPDFRGKNAQMEISGAACGDSICYVVNDESHRIQEFSIKDRRLIPGETRDLLERKAEIDAEAIAFANGVFYITGSHGLSRKKGKFRTEQFLIFRLKDGVLTQSNRLRTAINGFAEFAPYAEQKLNRNGVNIEGMAVIGDRLFFGFRGPSVKGRAFVLEVSAPALFGSEPLTPRLHAVALGDRIGVRDMVAVKGCILLLTGPVNTLPRRYQIEAWVPGKSTAHVLVTLPPPTDGKPEGLLVLETGATAYSALVLHDGARNGGPVQISIPRPDR